jgi:DnaJ-domain-containing protein 1
LAFSSVTPIVRFAAHRSRTRQVWGDAAQAAFARASLPRRIYYLLAAVAEIDGPMTTAEREAVRQFLLERVQDPIQAETLRMWEAQPLPIDDRVGLAARIATGLAAGELDSLFCWCCLVAFADGRFAAPEHRALQEVAQGLGLSPQRARMLFHLARAQYLRGQQRSGPEPARTAVGARAKALAELDLPADATQEQIRRRHRELVRKFHPDAQPQLGPVAQAEATERFRAIQRAYEVLTG